MHNSKSSLWWRDSNQTASGKIGAVQSLSVLELRLDGGSVEAVGDLDRLDDLAWCRARGDDWLERGAPLALEVPSVVVPRERNVILNARHADFGSVRVVEIFPFRFDPRMGG